MIYVYTITPLLSPGTGCVSICKMLFFIVLSWEYILLYFCCHMTKCIRRYVTIQMHIMTSRWRGDAIKKLIYFECNPLCTYVFINSSRAYNIRTFPKKSANISSISKWFEFYIHRCTYVLRKWSFLKVQKWGCSKPMLKA